MNLVWHRLYECASRNITIKHMVTLLAIAILIGLSAMLSVTFRTSVLISKAESELENAALLAEINNNLIWTRSSDTTNSESTEAKLQSVDIRTSRIKAQQYLTQPSLTRAVKTLNNASVFILFSRAVIVCSVVMMWAWFAVTKLRQRNQSARMQP